MIKINLYYWKQNRKWGNSIFYPFNKMSREAQVLGTLKTTCKAIVHTTLETVVHKTHEEVVHATREAVVHTTHEAVSYTTYEESIHLISLTW